MPAKDLNQRCRLNHAHKHGVSTRCYSAGGCRCDPCRKHRSRTRKGEARRNNALLGKDVRVPAGPTMRRLQALAYAGYGAIELSSMSGFTPRHLNGIRNGEQGEVRVSTARRIAALYTKHVATPSSDPRAVYVRAVAHRNGYESFTVWGDIDRGVRD